MDYELNRPPEVQSTFSVNLVSAGDANNSSVVVAKGGDQGHEPCQICSRKGHGATNCYNRFNAKQFPPTHNKKLTTVDMASDAISHTRNSSFNGDERKFYLNDLLLVPSASKNFLSVYQFCRNNRVFPREVLIHGL